MRRYLNGDFTTSLFPIEGNVHIDLTKLMNLSKLNSVASICRGIALHLEINETTKFDVRLFQCKSAHQEMVHSSTIFTPDQKHESRAYTANWSYF